MYLLGKYVWKKYIILLVHQWSNVPNKKVCILIVWKYWTLLSMYDWSIPFCILKAYQESNIDIPIKKVFVPKNNCIYQKNIYEESISS